jgi:hypothetical protein
MVWKVTNSLDGGTTKTFGGRDIDKYSRLFNGEQDVDAVSINSNWEYADNKFWFRNRSSSFAFKHRFPVLNNHVELTWPFLTTNDVVATLQSTGEFFNKTLDIRRNTVKGAGVAAATGKKTGQIVCGRQLGASAGDGILRGHIDRPSGPTVVTDNSPAGMGWEYSTGSGTANIVTGIEFPAHLSRRQWNLRFKGKISVPTTTTMRLYVGLSSDLTIPNTNTPLTNSDAGVVVGWTSTETFCTIRHNAGTGSPTVINTGLNKSTFTSPRTIEVLCRNQVPEIEVTIGQPIDALGNENVLYTTKLVSNIPPEQTLLAPTCTISNSDTLDHKFRIWGLEADQTM